MKFGRQQVQLLYVKPLTDNEINAALAFGDNDPAWRAIVQLLDKAKEDCVVTASEATSSLQDKVVLSEICGWTVLDNFLKDIVSRRQSGLNAK